MKKYVDRNQKVKDMILLSMKDLTQQIKNRETKKLMEKFVGLYKIKKTIRKCSGVGVTIINENSPGG